MSAPVLDQSYLDNVCESLPPDHPLRSNNNRLNSPQHQRVIYTCLYGSTTVTTVKHSIPQLIQHHRDTEACNQVAICLIENICQEWIIALGTAWNIDHSFFSRHASNPGGVSIWDAVMYPGGKWKSWSQNDNTAPTSAHVIGCFEHLKEDQSRPQRDRFPRRLQDHPLWGLHGTSNVSYWRVSPCLCK